MRKNHMSSHIKQESLWGHISASQTTRFVRGVHEQPVGLIGLLVEATSSSETSGARADNDNITVFFSGHDWRDMGGVYMGVYTK
mgnify:CR=1 FL=1